MLTRSWLAVLCGSVVAVAAYRDDNIPYAYQDVFQALPHDQLVLQPNHDQHHPPPGAPPGKTFPDKTVYEVLRDDDRFSRVFKLINFAEDIAAALNDPASTVTFFAPPDRALRPPHKHEREHVGRRLSEFDEDGVEAFFTNDVIKSTDKLELFAALEGFVDNAIRDNLVDDNDNDDKEDKERKKKILKRIVSAVLKYHTIGVQLFATDLARNTTFPSSLILNEGSLGNNELRIRVEQPKLIHPSLTLNIYAKVIYADVQTKNGIIHTVNHPLFPPPATFPILFGFFDAFSTLTSAIQRVNFTDAVDWHWNNDSKTLEGSPSVTFFAPTNKAFSRLPRKLKFFLFSPFGARALKKILSYHVIPEYVFHSNWIHNATDDLLPENAFSEPAIPDDPLFWLKNTGFPDEEYDSVVNRFTQQDARINHFARSPFDIPARPEADGYGFMRGEYHEPQRPSCCQAGTIHIPRLQSNPAMGAHLKCKWDRPDSSRGPSPPPPSHPLGSHPPPHKPIFEPVFTLNTTLPTLLGSNYTLNVHVGQWRSILPHGYITKVFVNGQPVVVADVPTRNGAIHVVNRLIKPAGHGKHGHHGHHGPEHPHEHPNMIFNFAEGTETDLEWEDWEEWLPQWANED